MLTRTPSNVEAQILIANATAGLQDVDGALVAYQKAIEMDPKRAGTYADMAAVQMVKGDRAKAAAAFEKAIQIDPASVKAQIAYGNFKWATGDIPEAEAGLKRALALDSKNAIANRTLARGEEFAERPVFRAAVDRNDIGEGADARDRHEIAERVVGQGLEQRHADRRRA